MFWAGVGVGILINSIVTVFVMALCIISGRGDNDGNN